MTVVLCVLVAYVLISVIAYPYLERRRRIATDARLRSHRQRMDELDSRHPEWKGTNWGQP